ncbi:cation transporting ATPase C-terminal domain-containing protein [Methanosarcina sp. UBA289]|uniref:cation transporting ATPase C-terminal domain-containing protein n=2 Tax=unclassified Methanosarcina TaxID=2644672 RepID=UPI0025EA3FC3|nr:cation transporting ATPase C-terminal domain-containing protein [Methanosarcina sp. UBA289]
MFAMHIPFMHELLSINPVSFENWLISFIIVSMIIFVMEIFKRMCLLKTTLRTYRESQ